MSTSPEPANDAPAEPLLTDDPEIQALLDFEPVPRRNKKQGGWSAHMQRLFIAKLAVHGSPGKACDELCMYRSGIDRVAKCAGAESFRAAWASAVEIAERRRAADVALGSVSTADLKLPFVDNRRKHSAPVQQAGEGEAWQEDKEEDEAAYRERIEDARDSISGKLQRCRRLYLQEISGSPGKRAAFEILTELPIDWETAARLEPQADEPWRRPNMRQPDMLLAAENGWLGGMAHGPDKVAELRAAIDAHRAERGMDPVDWDAGE